MEPVLFELLNGVVVPTVHCETLRTLRKIKENYPDDYLKIYQYFFYMHFPDRDLNPFFHADRREKEEIILEEIQAEFSTDEEDIVNGLEFCKKRWETETSRAYEGIATCMDNIATYMGTTVITDGKEGNVGQMRAMAKDFDSIRQSFKSTFVDLKDEQASKVRGDKDLAYDEDDD